MKDDDNKTSDFLLKNTYVKVFVNPSNFGYNNNPTCLYNILDQNYSVDLVSTSNQMILFRRDFNKPQNFHNFTIITEADTIYHITSDTIFTQIPINLNNNFTIQVLVKPAATQVPYAGIIGNHNNYEGFVIQQDNSNQNDYTFGFGNGISWEPSIKFHLNETEWNYLVVTVENKKIFVYRNGELIGSCNVISTIKNSGMPLYIGNWIGNDRQFKGSIKDVVISNSSISYKTVKSNWNSIQNRI